VSRLLATHGAVLLLAAASASAIAADPPPGNVRIYRCVDSSGAVSLQDEPCPGSRQQVLDMQRPQDPPPRSTSAAASAQADKPAREVREIRVVTVSPPRPMYECLTPDGERYTSDSAEGNPRQVPVWGYGVAPAPGPRPGAGPGPGPRPGPRPPAGGIRPGHGVVVPIGTTVVRDSCHALPQAEVCARLRDRRWELIRRYNSALQSEREELVREQRGIEARLDQDCGGT
jgi:hypothetical protein